MGILFNLEWKNINLQIEKSKFNLWKLKKQREEKVILNDGMLSMVIFYFYSNGYIFLKRDPSKMYF